MVESGKSLGGGGSGGGVSLTRTLPAGPTDWFPAAVFDWLLAVYVWFPFVTSLFGGGPELL